MTVLKLAAIDLNDAARISEQGLCGRLHCVGLPRTRGPEEQEVSNRPAIGRKPGEISLISPNDLLDCLFLPYDEALKFGLKILGFRSSHCGIQQFQPRPALWNPGTNRSFHDRYILHFMTPFSG